MRCYTFGKVLLPPETTLTRCANADGAEPSARNFDYAARYCATTASSFLTLSRLEHFRKLHLARRARVLGAAADPAAVRRGRDFDRRKRKKQSTQSWSRTHRDSLGCASPFFVLVSLLFVLFFFFEPKRERAENKRLPRKRAKRFCEVAAASQCCQALHARYR